MLTRSNPRSSARGPCDTTENLADQRPEAVARHRRLLYEHLATTLPSVAGDAPDGTVDPAAIRDHLVGEGMRNYL